MNDSALDLRAATREAVRAQVAERAVLILDERGFDETTVEQLAMGLGISPRSFFRYFSTKEDAVIGNLMPMGRLVERELVKRPASEPSWVSLRASFSPMVQSVERDPARVLRQARVAMSTPGLRARTIERHESWAAFLAPIVAGRLGGNRPNVAMAASALTQCALACLSVATVSWVEQSGGERFDVLLDIAFGSVQPLDHPSGE